MSSFCLIIPTYNAGKTLKNLLDKVLIQSILPEKIIIVDSSSNDNTMEIVNSYPDIQSIIIPKKEFNHGGTRDMAIRLCQTDYAVFVTQDISPCDNKLFEKLISVLETDFSIAMSYSRQVAYSNAFPSEKLVREFNYPDKSVVKDISDIPNLGIKTFFCSDSCAAYRISTYKELGGFLTDIQTNEDMFYAATAIKARYKIAYVAEAKVYHSHNFSFKQQYQRNFIIGQALERHKVLVETSSPVGEGLKMVKFVTIGLLKKFKIFSLIRFYCECFFRALGNRNGRKFYKKMRKVCTDPQRLPSTR